VQAAFERSIEQGELIEVAKKSGCGGRVFTTPQMKQQETEILQHMLRGQDRCQSLAPGHIRQATFESHAHLSDSQNAVVLQILTNRDRIMGLDGIAGTGKTTSLKAVCDAAEKSGFGVEGLAPTSRAALNLKEANISTKTLARHLCERCESSGSERVLYVVDESSMASTRQLHEFLTNIRSEDRVLLVGDTRQHEAVDAGRPYAQLQEAGMRTARLTEILRQKDIGLRAAVEQLSMGDAEAAIETLSRQGRVHQFDDREERVQAIARAYVDRPENTLVISPDNNSRMSIAERIHAELQGTGKVSLDEHTTKVLSTRQDLTSEDRRWAHNYEVGDVLRYSKSSKAISVSARELVRVHATNEKENLITVRRDNGQLATYDPRRVQGVTAFREAERCFAEGDRIQFTTAFHPQRIANRELGTIREIDSIGNLKLQMDSGRMVGFNIRQHPHLDYGYAITSYSSQCETCDRVLIHVDSEHAHKGLINSRMAYVAVSRARNDVQIYTNDAESLGQELSRDVSHSSALEREPLSKMKCERSTGSEHEQGMANAHGAGIGR
jgi:ATP-dependent exoDNAse (exonuclease V) alpha subunit